MDHGDDYCTSWYEMKEVLRRRFAPPLEPKKNILSSSGNSYMVASEFSCDTQFEKNASTNLAATVGCLVIFLQPHPLLEQMSR